MMATRHASIPLYCDDFLGSGTVGEASCEEVGAYVLLMIHDRGAGFAFDAERLARVCKMSPAKFRRAWAHLASKFPADPATGRHHNPKLRDIKQKQDAYKAAQADHARKRWPDGYPSKTRMGRQCRGNATHSLPLREGGAGALSNGAPLPDLHGEPPTADQLAALRAVKDSLRHTPDQLPTGTEGA